MKKRILLFPLLFLMITIFSCKDKTKEQSKLEYSKYISGFTQGMIKSSDPIYVRLENNILQTGDSLPVQVEKLLKISPKAEGTVSLRDGNIIEFTPTKPLKKRANIRHQSLPGQTLQSPYRLVNLPFQRESPPSRIRVPRRQLEHRPHG